MADFRAEIEFRLDEIITAGVPARHTAGEGVVLGCWQISQAQGNFTESLEDRQIKGRI